MMVLVLIVIGSSRPAPRPVLANRCGRRATQAFAILQEGSTLWQPTGGARRIPSVRSCARTTAGSSHAPHSPIGLYSWKVVRRPKPATSIVLWYRASSSSPRKNVISWTHQLERWSARTSFPSGLWTVCLHFASQRRRRRRTDYHHGRRLASGGPRVPIFGLLLLPARDVGHSLLFLEATSNGMLDREWKKCVGR